MSDIVERLRVGICYQQCRVKDTASGCECAEAADRIERLEAEVAEQVQWVKDLADGLMEAEGKIGVKEARIAQLEAALRPLACTCEARHQVECRRGAGDCPFWNARAALGEERT